MPAFRDVTLMPDLPSYLWLAITRLGGAGVTLPLALAIAAWLAIGYTWKMALHWLLALGAAIAIVMATKIAFLGFGLGIFPLDFTGISGHAMLAGAVYPFVFFLILARTGTAWRMAGIAAGLAVSVTISCSRIVLAAHSPAEAVSGFVLGALTVLLFLCGWWRAQPHHRLRAVPVMASLAALIFALHDVIIPTHRWITQLALAVSGHERPFARIRWHRMSAMKNSGVASGASASAGSQASAVAPRELTPAASATEKPRI